MSDKYFIEQLSAVVKSAVNIIARDLREIGGLQGSRSSVTMEFATRSYSRVARVIHKALMDVSKLYAIETPKQIKLYMDGARKLISTSDINSTDHSILNTESILGTFAINPIGGIANFARAIPLINVDISVQTNGEQLHYPSMSHAIMYNLNENVFLTATTHNGAYLDNNKIKISSISNINNAYAIIEGFESAARFGTHPSYDKHLLLAIKNLSMQCSSNLKLGNTSLALAYLACGRVDFVIDLDISDPLEIAAGFFIAKESGAMITTIDGRSSDVKDMIQDRALIASNGIIHDSLIARIQKGLSKGKQ